MPHPYSPRRLLFALLLRLYPIEFREAFADDLLRTLEDRDRWGNGDQVQVSLLREAWALARTALALRWHVVLTSIGRGVRRIVTSLKDITMDTLWQDIRYATRNLLRARTFTIVTVVTLSLGIGANATIFSVMDAVMFKPLPYGDPASVVTIWSSWIDFAKTWVSRSEFRYYRQNAASLTDVGLYQKGSATLTVGDVPRQVYAGVMTSNTFGILGVEPLLGRNFTQAEAIGEAPVVLIGHDLWRGSYGEDPSILGKTILVDGEAVEVLGVMPVGFQLPLDYTDGLVTQIWGPLPLALEGDGTVARQGGSHQYYGVARLAPGHTVQDAHAELTGMSVALEAEGVYPTSWNFRPLVLPVSEDILGAAKPALLVLAGTVVFVLLIACANVANLFLIRAQSRVREMAVRAALGAGRPRLLAQLFIESGLLAAAGGALGLALAWTVLRGLAAFDPGSIPRLNDVSIHGGVVAFTAGVTLLATFLFGAVPGQRASRPDLHHALREGGRSGDRSGGRQRFRATLVGAQVAMAVVLVTGAGLMTRSFSTLTAVDPGFHPDRVLTFRTATSSAYFPTLQERSRFLGQLVDALEESPDVRRAAVTSSLPLADQLGNMPVTVEGFADVPEGGMWGDWQVVTPGYFETMGLPLVAGRFFDERETVWDTTGLTIIINETMARSYWPNRDPIGGRMTAGGRTLTVVGVVGDVRHDGLTADISPKWYRPSAPFGADRGWLPGRNIVVVAARNDPATLANTVRTTVQRLDPRIAVSDLRTTDDVYSSAIAQPRFTMLMLGMFSALALTLATVGVYGVIAYTVGQRRGEIGIRMALGAQAPRVVGEVVRNGMAVVGLGIVAGSATALTLSRFMAGFLYGVGVRDPMTFAVVPALLSLVALVATYLPARRAARVDPASALRVE